MRAVGLDAFGIMATFALPMSAIRTTPLLPDLPRRVLAAACAVLVLALTILAASPAAHASLHDDGHDHCRGDAHGHAPSSEDHSCAVVLFASGVSLPVAPVAVLPPTSVPLGVSPVTAAEVYLVSPRYLRQPERGPPAVRVS